MNVSPRTATLLARLPDHPLSASMRTAMIAAAAASEGFVGHKIALESDGRMTPRGQQDALRESLAQNHGKQWARANASVVKARKEIEAERAALVIKPVDPSNFAAALERQEIRAWVRQLDLGVRQSVVLATKDRRILEAVVSAPPELSGFAGDAAFASKIEAHYFELVFPDQLAAIEAKNDVVSVAEAAMHVQRNELRATVNVDMHPRDFDALMKPVETIRPWLIDNRTQVCEVGADGKPSYRQANESDLAFGVEYKNYDEYKAAQGLADAA
jgi:hypothetical protein